MRDLLLVMIAPRTDLEQRSPHGDEPRLGSRVCINKNPKATVGRHGVGVVSYCEMIQRAEWKYS